MQPHWITIALVAALAGAAGATIAHELLPDRAAGSAQQQPASIEPEAEPQADLRVQLDRIEQRIAALELRPTSTARVVASSQEKPEDVETLPLGAALTTSGAISEPVLQDQVAQALERIRERERFEREQAQEQERVEQLDRQLEKLQAALGLGHDQVNEMRTLYENQRQAKIDLQRMWEDGFDRELVAQSKNDSAARYRAELERILTPEQLESFELMYDQKQARRDSDRSDARIRARKPSGK